MRRFRHGFMCACICVVASACVQCGRAGDLVESDGSTLTIHVPDQDERALGPSGDRLWFLVFLGLTVDPEGTGDQRPRLLTRWEHTPDYTEWIMHLRDDVRWDDGIPVTAEDVKFSLEMWSNTEVGYEYRWFDEIEVLDRSTLRVTFERPVTGTIFEYTWLPMLPKHRLDALDLQQMFSWPFWIQPIGDGPYRYAKHTPEIMTELKTNPDYYGEKPRIPTVVLRYGGEPVAELLKGTVDIASDITPLESVQLAADPRFRVYHRVGYQWQVAIAWNHRNSLFQDAAVRRALTMSIDRRELHRILNYPDDLPLFDVPAAKRHFVQGMVPDPVPFDRDRAARLLASAGWVDTDGDGIREKNGEKFLFTLSISPETETHAVYIQEQFRRVGVGMGISTYEPITLHWRLREHDFDATIQRYNYLEQFGEFLISGYENPEASRLRDAVWFTIDREAADRHLREFWKIFETDIPVTYLHHRISLVAAHRRVRGLQNDRSLFSSVENLWIEDEEGMAGPP